MADPLAGIGKEIEFADGKRVIDEPFVPYIHDATDGHPERVSFKDAMRLANKQFGKAYLKKAQSQIVREHLKIHGL